MWHDVARYRNSHDAAGQFDLEVAIAVRHTVAASQVKDIATRQDHRQRVHPCPCCSVLEGRCASRVGGDGAAYRCSEERWTRRVDRTARLEPFPDFDQRDAGSRSDSSIIRVDQGSKPRRTQHDVASRCRTASQGRLRTDRQHRPRGRQNIGHLSLVSREHDRAGVTARYVRGIIQERRDAVSIGDTFDRTRVAARWPRPGQM